LRESELRGQCVRLLASFDPYLLAHADKEHLIPPQNYKRVFRSLGWISPVVLVRGVVAGTWAHEVKKGQVIVSILPFGPISRAVREGIEEEAERLARFLGAAPAFRFSGS
jgi:winged helix DNA-binding protein